MRYAACLADRLWEGIESEGIKVLFQLVGKLTAKIAGGSRGQDRHSRATPLGYVPGSSLLVGGADVLEEGHWGQVVVFLPGTLPVHCPFPCDVLAMNPPGTF